MSRSYLLAKAFKGSDFRWSCERAGSSVSHRRSEREACAILGAGFSLSGQATPETSGRSRQSHHSTRRLDIFHQEE
ncbi:hypothetical protein KGM_205413 [Danaus plexippus plexippus]|uniref:Uncharacterized protein n=1 Tax=Danaus plexippus plexippus TaxID=278856 RepID=A0A212F7P4_DANPL|nr:hypothetical protein KGM_205413 [Danaus plexippus plexippus]